MKTIQEITEDAAKMVAAGLGKEIPPEMLAVAADLIMGIVASATKTQLKRAALAGQAAADAIQTNEDATARLSR